MPTKDKLKYYAVWNGIEANVYKTWDEAKPNCIGIKNVKHKSFQTINESS